MGRGGQEGESSRDDGSLHDVNLEDARVDGRIEIDVEKV